MPPITSARGRKRAEQEIATRRHQLESIAEQRKQANRQFDAMEEMVSGEICDFSDAIHDYDTRTPVQALPAQGVE